MLVVEESLEDYVGANTDVNDDKDVHDRGQPDHQDAGEPKIEGYALEKEFILHRRAAGE